MPANLSFKFNINPKKFRLTALFLLSPIFFFAQSLTGLWNGTLSNDSTIIRVDQPFEMALTEYKGKVYGYSRRSFIVNDTLYYVLKRVKGTIEGDSCEVTENEYISYNFPGKPDKGVKITYTFHFNKKDSSWSFDGKWKTNKVKGRYYALTGKVDLKEEKDVSKSKLFPHLEELNLADDLAFYKEKKKETDIEKKKPVQTLVNKEAVSAKGDSKTPEEKTTAASIENDTWTNNEIKKRETTSSVSKPTAIPKNEKVKTLPASSSTSSLSKNNIPKVDSNLLKVKTDVAIVKTDSKQQPGNETVFASSVTQKQEAISPNIKKDVTTIKAEQPTLNKEVVSNSANSETKTIAKTTNSEIKKSETLPDKQNSIASSKTATEKKEINKDLAAVVTKTEKKNESVPSSGAAALFTERKSEFSQVVNFKSDSLELALYDNGEIDGDTVSILLNGEIILAKQGLKAVAIKKTIYITSQDEEFNVVLYAENLGKYPPNTGLLVVHDGDDVYNVRFTADFQTNAGIVFKRKKKQ